MIPLLCAAALAAALDSASLQATLRDYNAAAVYPLPSLSAEQRQALANGEMLKLLLPAADGTSWVVGLVVSDQPRDALWLASQDLHFASPEESTEIRLSANGDKAVWYGFLDLPFPFDDRHWVVDSWNNHALAARTGNRMWEHPWKLRGADAEPARSAVTAGKAPGVTVEMFEEALYTPTNHGAFLFVALPDGRTLLGYHATFVIGGNIPDRVAAEFIRQGIERLLRRLERIAAQTVPGHYVAGHAPVLGGDGQPIPPGGR